MTAIVAVVGSSAIRIVSDSAGYEPDGRLSIWMPKTVTLPHLGAAYVTAGHAACPWSLTRVLYSVYDDIADIIEAGTVERDMAAHGYRIDDGTTAPEDDPRMVRVVVGGWSQRLGLTAWQSRDGRMQRVPLGGYVATPGVPPGQLHADANLTHMSASMVDIVSRQRALVPLVGGAVVMTSIHAPRLPGEHARIEQRIIHAWPDRIGEQITA
jgi:hypothetical protein